MARRLSDELLRREGAIADADIGKRFCRNCHGGIALDGADERDGDVPHRLVCQRCGGEYGTTLATPYPQLREYSDVTPGFYSSVRGQPIPR
jgi:hypothetical protein